MHSAARPTSRGVHSKWPEAAAPQSTPQMSGIQVTGFISCSRIFQMLVSAEAPFMPSSCALPSTPRNTCWRLPSSPPLPSGFWVDGKERTAQRARGLSCSARITRRYPLTRRYCDANTMRAATAMAWPVGARPVQCTSKAWPAGRFGSCSAQLPPSPPAWLPGPQRRRRGLRADRHLQSGAGAGIVPCSLPSG